MQHCIFTRQCRTEDNSPSLSESSLLQAVKKADFSIRTGVIEILSVSRILKITYANTRPNQTVTRCRICPRKDYR